MTKQQQESDDESDANAREIMFDALERMSEEDAQMLADTFAGAVQLPPGMYPMFDVADRVTDAFKELGVEGTSGLELVLVLVGESELPDESSHSRAIKLLGRWTRLYGPRLNWYMRLQRDGVSDWEYVNARPVTDDEFVEERRVVLEIERTDSEVVRLNLPIGSYIALVRSLLADMNQLPNEHLEVVPVRLWKSLQDAASASLAIAARYIKSAPTE